MSDGTMLLLAFLVLAHLDPPPALITIDEVERGLHPYLLGELMTTLRGLATGELTGTPIQVVVATHSPVILDHVEPGEARFLRRSAADGSVIVEEAPTDSAEFQEALHEYEDSLGSAWLAGGLGGVPAN